jgi:hypothetical protein
MKKSIFVFFAGIIAFSGCNDTVTETVTYMINEPVFMSEEAFRKSIVVTPEPQTISNYGKMCFYDGYIYIAESEKGIHIVNNSDPKNPHCVGFIELIGNADLAIREGKLYADALIDLVWFDVSTPEVPTLEGRLENVFSKYVPVPPTGNEYRIDYDMCFDNMSGSKGIIVGWNLKERTETITYEASGRAVRFGLWGGRYDVSNDAMVMEKSPGSSVGANGSMSRFTIYQDYLYSVINNKMDIIDLRGEKPEKAAEGIYIGGNVETIFSYGENMFMGTPTGMLIYSVADPLKPEYMSSVSHVFGCDPVVVENDIAYVTIHSGNWCGQNVNDLMIYDVSNVKAPIHLKTYPMKKPKGLGIDSGTLFLCDDGLKIFDASDPYTLLNNQLVHYAGMEGFDVIPFKNVLMMIAEDGLYQYDYSDLTKIYQLSKLPIVK